MHKNLNKKLFFITLIIYFFIFSIEFSSAVPSATIVDDIFGFGYSQQSYEPENNLSDQDKSGVQFIKRNKDEIWKKPDSESKAFYHYRLYSYYLDPEDESTYHDGEHKFTPHPIIDQYYKGSGLHEKIASAGNEAFANMWHPEIRGDIYRLNLVQLITTQVMINNGKVWYYHIDGFMFAAIWVIEEDQEGTRYIKAEHQVDIREFNEKQVDTVNENFFTSENTGTLHVHSAEDIQRMGGYAFLHGVPIAGPERSILGARYKFRGKNEELSKFYFLKAVEQMEINKNKGKGLKLTKSILSGEFSVNGIEFANIKTEEQLSIFARSFLKKKLRFGQRREVRRIAKGLLDRAKSRHTDVIPSESLFDKVFGC